MTAKCDWCGKQHNTPNMGRRWFCSYKCDLNYVMSVSVGTTKPKVMVDAVAFLQGVWRVYE